MAKRRQTNHEILINMYDALYNHFGPQRWWPGDTPFEIAVGAVLTQNTNWGNVEKAIHNVKREKALSAKKLLDMPPNTLAALIRPAGYFNVKTKRLRNFLSFLSINYRASMKRMEREDQVILREALLLVNGIGPETADSILLYALNKPVFVIDAYTKRVLSRHGVVSEMATYDELQELFHRNLPRDVALFNEYHALFVMTGKDYCKPRPKCAACPLEPLL